MGKLDAGGPDRIGNEARVMMEPIDGQALWEQLRKQTILVVGFTERTGRSAARLLEAHGVPYRISDRKELDELRPLLHGLRVSEADVFSGPQGIDQLEGITTVLSSPGVPRSIPLLVEARRRGVPVLSDIDFIYPFIRHKPIVAITGTDGKTTTTVLTSELLATRGKVVVAGNIGVPVLAKLDEIGASDVVVLEVSSFMLEELRAFRPTVAVITNVAEDHVDRYASFADYVEAKRNIVRHCGSGDVLIVNADDSVLAGFRPKGMVTRTFSARGGPSDYAFENGCFKVGGASIRYEACRLRGVHHAENVLASIAVAEQFAVPWPAIEAAVSGFGGLAHRFSFVGTVAGVDVYDDSKATTAHAVDGALRSLDGRVVLIMGGRGKGLDVTCLRLHASRVKALVCYGEAGSDIHRALGFERSCYARGFEEAVALAVDASEAGDTLLLSPGCTSWDQFENYEARGAAFQSVATRLLSRRQGECGSRPASKS